MLQEVSFFLVALGVCASRAHCSSLSTFFKVGNKGGHLAQEANGLHADETRSLPSGFMRYINGSSLRRSESKALASYLFTFVPPRAISPEASKVLAVNKTSAIFAAGRLGT